MRVGAASRLAGLRECLRLGHVRHFLSVLRRGYPGSAFRAVADGAVVAVLLKRRGLRAVLRRRPTIPDADPEQARQIADAVDAGLGLLPIAPTCLRRSVTLLRELDRRQMGANLHIGVRHGAEGVEAHAWVQVGSRVVNDDPERVRTYVELSAGDAERLKASFT